MMGKAIQVMPRGVYQGFKGKKLGQWPLSFQHHLDIYSMDATHADFETFIFYQKLSPYVAADMPLPIKTEMMKLVRQRTLISDFTSDGSTKSSRAKPK
jgi:hypothetical protein